MLLDLDDTLIEEAGFAHTQLRRTAELVDGVDADGWDDTVIEAARTLWYGSTFYPDFLSLGFASWEGLWATFDGVHPRLEGLGAWSEEYRRDAWRAALRSAGAHHSSSEPSDALVDALSARYIAGQRSGHPLLPGAAELVQRLAASVPVVLVTNGPPDIQRLKIEQAGIGPLLSGVVISGETGIGKPDPAAFGHALELVGVGPEHAVMVGDSWERDVQGALGAGMRAIWISQGQPAPSTDSRVSVAEGPADVEILL